MNRRTARAIQVVCTILVVGMLLMIFLAHAHGRVAAEVVIVVIVLAAIAVALEVFRRTQAVIHDQDREQAIFDKEIADRFTPSNKSKE